jgi:hypothetical protein
LALVQKAVAPDTGGQSLLLQHRPLAMQETLLQFLNPLPQAYPQAPVAMLQVPTSPVTGGVLQSLLEQQFPLGMQVLVPQGL